MIPVKKLLRVALVGVLASASSALVLAAETTLTPLQPSKEQAKTAVEIIERLEQRHYSRLNFDDALSSLLLDNYLDKLDPARLFLYQSDIAEFERWRLQLDDALRRGDLTAGFTLFNRYSERADARLSRLLENLPGLIQSLDFDRQEYLQVDRSHAPWPKDQAESDDLWRKRIKHQVLSLKLAGKAEADIIELLEKRYRNQLMRLHQQNPEDAFQLYINALTELYDPHTNYLSPQVLENFNINMSLSLEGIGAVLQSEEEYTKVVRLVPAGPADRQGQLRPADRIVAVAQGLDGEFQDVVGWRLDEVVQLIRGPKGSVVRLEVVPAGSASDGSERRIINIERNKVELEDQSAQSAILELDHQDHLVRLGVIQIPAFYIDFDAMRRGDPNYRSTTRDVKRLLDELVSQGIDGLVIDLRRNGGGSLQEANELTGLFIDAGPTVQIRHSTSRVYRQGKVRSSPYYDGPMAVLVDRLSASASEIFAGAIQDYQRGVIVGSQSFGKGTVQALVPLPHGQLKLTESKFYRISGESTQHRGVVPDIQLPSLIDPKEVGESALDHALPWDTIDPVRHPFYFELTSILPELQRRHDDRTADDADFVFLRDQKALMDEQGALEEIPLQLAERQAEREQQQAKALELENRRRQTRGLALLSTLDEAPTDDADTHDEVEAIQAADKGIDITDMLLRETGHILVDTLELYRQQVAASSWRPGFSTAE